MISPFATPPQGVTVGTASLRLQAAGAGLTYRELDLRQVRDRADLMRALSDDLALPPYFGHNLDALMDVLTDPQVFAHSLAIGLCGWQRLRRTHPALFATLEDTLLDAQSDLARQGRALYLLELDGPTQKV